MKLAKITKLTLTVLLSGALLAPVQADDTPLAEQMDEISSSLKGLRRAETWADKVALAQAAQAACLKSLEHLPATFEKITDEKEKAKATADYKRLMGKSFAALCALESAFLEEDEDAVDAAMDAIKALKKEGHEKYEDDE